LKFIVATERLGSSSAKVELVLVHAAEASDLDTMLNIQVCEVLGMPPENVAGDPNLAAGGPA